MVQFGPQRWTVTWTGRVAIYEDFLIESSISDESDPYKTINQMLPIVRAWNLALTFSPINDVLRDMRSLDVTFGTFSNIQMAYLETSHHHRGAAKTMLVLFSA